MSFLAGLNDAQRRAVDHHEGPLLVVAGAGSGKTRALTHRIAHLIGEHASVERRIAFTILLRTWGQTATLEIPYACQINGSRAKMAWARAPAPLRA